MSPIKGKGPKTRNRPALEIIQTPRGDHGFVKKLRLERGKTPEKNLKKNTTPKKKKKKQKQKEKTGKKGKRKIRKQRGRSFFFFF